MTLGRIPSDRKALARMIDHALLKPEAALTDEARRLGVLAVGCPRPDRC